MFIFIFLEALKKSTGFRNNNFYYANNKVSINLTHRKMVISYSLAFDMLIFVLDRYYILYIICI